MTNKPTQSEGGVGPETTVVTTSGPVPVEALREGEVLYGLDLETNLLVESRLIELERIPCNEPLVSIQTKRCSLSLHPDTRVPYLTKTVNNVRFQRAGDLRDRAEYKFLNYWSVPPQDSPEQIDVTDLVDEYEIRTKSDVHGHTFRASLPGDCIPCRRNSHTGYYFDPETFKRYQEELETVADELSIVGGWKQRGRPYRFRTDDFVQFLGWFITEGSVAWSKTRNTGTVHIGQEKLEHRVSIERLLTRMGFDVEVTDRTFRFGSELYARLLTNRCGKSSRDRRLPDLVWTLSRRHHRMLFETLMAGDGNSRGTYYTVSDDLAHDMCRLALLLGMKPRYIQRGDLWELYFSETNDGFHSETHITQVDSPGTVYRLTVEETPVVMAGHNGKFQWCGVN